MLKWTAKYIRPLSVPFAFTIQEPPRGIPEKHAQERRRKTYTYIYLYVTPSAFRPPQHTTPLHSLSPYHYTPSMNFYFRIAFLLALAMSIDAVAVPKRNGKRPTKDRPSGSRLTVPPASPEPLSCGRAGAESGEVDSDSRCLGF